MFVSLAVWVSAHPQICHRHVSNICAGTEVTTSPAIAQEVRTIPVGLSFLLVGAMSHGFWEESRLVGGSQLMCSKYRSLSENPSLQNSASLCFCSKPSRVERASLQVPMVCVRLQRNDSTRK